MTQCCANHTPAIPQNKCRHGLRPDRGPYRGANITTPFGAYHSLNAAPSGCVGRCDYRNSRRNSGGGRRSALGLTIPIMLFVTHFTGRPFYLRLQNSSFVMLLLTLFLSAVVVCI
jgi:hypothetical protein